MKNNNKEPLFIRERKTNYWRGFRSAFVCMFASIGILIVAYYTMQYFKKPTCQTYYVCDPANMCCSVN